MRKLLILLLSVLSLSVVAQQKKVAVYVTGDNPPMNEVWGSKLTAAIARSGKYAAVERTAAFLYELSKEQNYQRTGAVNDAELSELGKQFGVQLVCVANVSKLLGEDYISVRLIDVETAQIVCSANINATIRDLDSLVENADLLSTKMLSLFERERADDARKVAVYIMQSESNDINRILGDKLAEAFSNSQRYIAIERTNDFLSQLNKEVHYQQTGMVDDNELSRLGVQFGVDYVCVAKISEIFGEQFISTRLIDVKTAEVANIFDINGSLTNMQECINIANSIGLELSKGSISMQRKEVVDDFKMKKDFVFIKGGTYTLKRNKSTNDQKSNIKITLPDYHICKYEVTQAQYYAIMGINPSYFKGDNLPVEMVSWYDCQEFVKKLNELTSMNFALPTEYQWEFAALGGDKSKGYLFAGGNNVLSIGWTDNNSNNHTHIVGQKLPNELGLYDMTGNVWEWCLDAYNENDTQIDETDRIIRGGSWFSVSNEVLSRCSAYIDQKNFHVGFRLVLIPQK